MKNKTLVWGIVIIIVIIAAVLLFTQNKAVAPVQESVTTTDADTAGWKLYVNYKAVYQVLYPSDWKISEKDTSVTIFNPERKDEVLTIEANKTGESCIQSEWSKDSYGESTRTACIPSETQSIKIKALAYTQLGINSEEKIIKSLKFSSGANPDMAGGRGEQSSPELTPVITSITPTSGPVGTLVSINGKNLSGLEGDLTAVFTTPNGQEVELTDKLGDYAKTAGNLIRVVANSPCKEGETVYGSYSGIASPCRFVPFTPGVYKIRVSAWGKTSNSVQFTITK